MASVQRKWFARFMKFQQSGHRAESQVVANNEIMSPTIPLILMNEEFDLLQIVEAAGLWSETGKPIGGCGTKILCGYLFGRDVKTAREWHDQKRKDQPREGCEEDLYVELQSGRLVLLGKNEIFVPSCAP
ncbi:hypothetical protein HZA45_00980 [Candidatus Peregrinibacteria bacterium]|nr:hypothetical protein [Candidatus Peregrinibacteria bacterium]